MQESWYSILRCWHQWRWSTRIRRRGRTSIRCHTAASRSVWLDRCSQHRNMAYMANLAVSYLNVHVYVQVFITLWAPYQADLGTNTEIQYFYRICRLRHTHKFSTFFAIFCSWKGDKNKTELASILLNRLAVLKTVKDSPCRFVHHRLSTACLLIRILACPAMSLYFHSHLDERSPHLPPSEASSYSAPFNQRCPKCMQAAAGQEDTGEAARIFYAYSA